MLATYWHACMHPRKLNVNSRNSSEHLYLQILNPLKISIHRTCTLILLTLTDQQSSSWISHVCSMVPDSTPASLHSPYYPLHHTVYVGSYSSLGSPYIHWATRMRNTGLDWVSCLLKMHVKFSGVYPSQPIPALREGDYPNAIGHAKV